MALDKIKVLLTKPLRQEQLALLASKPIELAMHAFIALSNVQDIEWPTKVPTIQAVFTSPQAIRAIESKKDYLPPITTIYCIQGKTEALARSVFGTLPIYYAEKYARDLLPKIIDNASILPIWFFKGDRALPTIADGLSAAGIDFSGIEVYRNDLKPKTIEGYFDAILFFSPSAVESFLKSNNIPMNTITFAVGKTTAKALKPYTNNIVIADESSEESMVAKLCEIFNI